MAAVRKYLGDMELTEAVNTAVEECIRADILKEFLMEHKAEVIAMSIYEYNEEYVRKSLFEDGLKTGYNKGYDSGFDTGFDFGQQNGAAQKLIQNIDSIIKKLGVSLEKACEILDISVEEYENAKKY